MIMIVKTPGSQVGLPAAAEEEDGKTRGGGRGGGGEERGVGPKLTLEKTVPKE